MPLPCVCNSVKLISYFRFMPPEILALLDKPISLLILLPIGAAIGIEVERLVEGQKRAERRTYWQGRNAKPKWGSKITPIKPEKPQALDLAADQLRHVIHAKFTARPLLNQGKQRLLSVLDKALA